MENKDFWGPLRNHAGAKGWLSTRGYPGTSCSKFPDMTDIAGGWCQGTIPGAEEQTANEALNDQLSGFTMRLLPKIMNTTSVFPVHI